MALNQSYWSGYGDLEDVEYDRYGVVSYKGPDVRRGVEEPSLGGTPYGAGDEDKKATTSSRAVRSIGPSAGTQYRPATGSTVTQTRIAPAGPAPTLGPVPEFEVPELNRRRIAAAAQKKTAAQRQKLRRYANRALASARARNPVAAGVNLERVLEGYGTGLAAARAQGEAAALREETEQYAKEFAGAQMTYQAQRQAQMAEFEAAWRDYLNKYTTTTTSKNIYGTTPTEESSSGPGVYRVGPWGVGTYWSPQ